jgi:hypothetical protein
MCYRDRRCLPSTPLPRSGLVLSGISDHTEGLFNKLDTLTKRN